MELISPELVLVASTEERKRILALLPDRDPFAFMERPALQPPSEPDATAARPLLVTVAAYLLLDVAAWLVYGVMVLAALVAVLTIVEVATR